jgi:hypothetical protein
MIDREEGAGPDEPGAARQAPDVDLAYRIELWDDAGSRVERVLARAGALMVARAIFRAACNEHFGRRVTLSRAGRILEQPD